MGHSIGPFVFDQYVNPPRLSHAFNEGKMSGWSPENKSLDFLQSTYGLTRYTEFRIGIFQTRRKFPLLGMMDATKYVKTWEDACGNGIRRFVFF